MARAHFRGEQA
jgi:hypothetical protein